MDVSVEIQMKVMECGDVPAESTYKRMVTGTELQKVPNWLVQLHARSIVKEFSVHDLGVPRQDPPMTDEMREEIKERYIRNVMGKKDPEWVVANYPDFDLEGGK